VFGVRLASWPWDALKSTKKEMNSIITSLIFLSALLSASTCSSQGKDIEYQFDKNLDDAVVSFLNKEMKDAPQVKFYFIISRANENRENFCLYIGTYRDAPLDFIGRILQSTHRIYHFNQVQIPICFDYDFEFIGYGNDKRGITRTALTGELYYIEFKKGDKIVRSGY